MIITRPKVEPDGLYSINKAAKALHIDRHTMSRYAAKGMIAFRRRKADGRPVTTGKEIIRCWESMYP